MPRKIIEYGMAAGSHYKELAGIVNEAITEGFQPYKKPFLANYGEQELLHQVMVRYEVKKKTSPQSNKLIIRT